MFDVIQAFKDIANKFSALQTAISGKANSGHSHSNYASTVTTTGSGNAVTEISQSGNTITATKGKTFSESGHTHNYAGSPSAGGDANNALKLGGKSLSKAGDRHGVIPFIETDGVMEVGKYIDFHLSDTGTDDSGGGRLESDGTNLKFKNKKLATIEGSQTAARTGKIIIGDIAIVFGIVSATSGATAGDGLYTGNATVNYGVTFKNTPVIVPAFSGRLNQMRAVGTSSVTTTSANIWFKATSANAEMSVQWIAIGQLA